MKPTLTHVVDKLHTLGSADQIALFFQQQGVTGLPSSARFCPVAEHISRETGSYWVLVSRFTVTDCQVLGQSMALDDGPVADFVYRFDRGLYPELVAK